MVARDASGVRLRSNKLLDLVSGSRAFSDGPYHARRTLAYGSVDVDPREPLF